LSFNELESLRRLDTCTVSNAIERFDVRPRNEGFIYNDLTCRFPHFAPMLGYAATARIRSSTSPATSPPITRGCYYDRMDFWRYLINVPSPRVMVLQDVDRLPGFGAFVGEIHAQIALALDCIGCVTNGAVRDLPAVEATGFHLFSGKLSVSHAFAHIVDFGGPVELGGLKISPGDLVLGDGHGVLTIPDSLAPELPQMAARLLQEESCLIDLCKSRSMTLEKLEAQLRKTARACIDLEKGNGDERV